MVPSLTIPPFPTSSIPLTSSPSLVPPNPSSFFFPLNAVSQNIIMSGAVRNKGAGAQQPPRPPNAWILYRSDKLQQLPPPALGQPKPTQAEVSKIISVQWKTESDEVRAMYDERAQIAKLEHSRLYPNYRFTPMKRADKDRMREEKRQAKEQERAGRRTRGRASPYTLPPTASSSTPPVPHISQSILPNSKTASPPVSSASSPIPGTPSSQCSADIAMRHGSTHASHDPSTDPRPNSSDSQSASSRASSYSRADIPLATPLPAVPARLMLSTAQAFPHQGWQPPQPEASSTFLSPLQEFGLGDWPPPSNEALPLENDNIFFSMPGFENEPLQDMRPSSLLAELYGTELPGVYQLQGQGLANPGLTARPPGSINLGVGNYPPGMCGSSAFDDALRSLGEDPATFMTNPTEDELLAAISMLAPPQQQQETDELLSSSSGSAHIDVLQAFNFDEYLQDFGASVPAPVVGDSVPPGMRSVTVTLSVPQNSPVESPPSESGASASPMASFYTTTPSPVSAIEQSPPPQQSKHQPYVPPRGAANAAARRVGGSWKVPLAVSRLASPIPSCTSSPKQAAV
jgi:hypothetical protein